MDIRFQHPEYFIALLVLPLAGWLYLYILKGKERTMARIGDRRLVAELISDYSPKKFLIRYGMVTAALTCVVLAIINPQRPGKGETVERRGVDVMVALDVSNSMLAEDIKPNRLERSKLLINNLVQTLENDRVGLILFAGRAYMQMPLTLDHGAALMYVQNASTGMVPTQGTMISEALKLGNASFNNKERKYKAIVLITDGEDHDPESVAIAESLASNGVMVNTIGIGSTTGTPIPDPLTGQYKKDELGNTVISKLNETTLRQLAASTNGIYVGPANINEAVDLITSQLATIETTAMEDAAFRNYEHYFQWFVLLALLLLGAEFFMSDKRKGVAT